MRIWAIDGSPKGQKKCSMCRPSVILAVREWYSMCLQKTAERNEQGVYRGMGGHPGRQAQGLVGLAWREGTAGQGAELDAVRKEHSAAAEFNESMCLWMLLRDNDRS